MRPESRSGSFEGEQPVRRGGSPRAARPERLIPDAKRFQTFDPKVDRDVPIAISMLKYRAGTARSTFPDAQSLFVIGISQRIGLLQRR